MLDHILNGIGAVGNLLDLPGSSVRDVLAGKNPFDQYTTPLHDTNRTSGRDLLRHYGLASHENTWGNFAGGLAAETLLDPTNLIPGKALANAFRASRVAKQTNVGIRASNAASIAQRAAGHMPEEIAKLTAVKTAEGLPRRMYHGTNAVFDQFDNSKIAGENLYGQGHYLTSDPAIASSYTGKEGSYAIEPGASDVLRRSLATHTPGTREHSYIASTLKRINNPNLASSPEAALADLQFKAKLPQHIIDQVVTDAPQNVRMHYLDVRNPLDVAGTYGGEHGLPIPQPLSDYLRRNNRDALRAGVDLFRTLNESSVAKGRGAREFPKTLLEEFSQRNNIPEMTGRDLYNQFENNNSLRSHGFDGITHEGGQMRGTKSHDVVVAFDPKQVYKPYIAKAIQPELKAPSVAPQAAGLAAYASLARARRRKQ